jgi:peroxin-7
VSTASSQKNGAQPNPLPCALTGVLVDVDRFDTQDSLFDTAWSETHENQIVVGCGDGAVKLFDTSVDEFPVQSWQEHSREVFSVYWNLVSKDIFASSSWDGTIKIVR